MYHEEYDRPPSKVRLRDSSTVECSFKLLNSDGKPDVDNVRTKNGGVKQNGCQIPNTMIDDLHFIRQNMDEQISEGKTMSQWKHVGRIVDRCLLMVFLIYATITTLVLIIRSMGPAEHDHH